MNKLNGDDKIKKRIFISFLLVCLFFLGWKLADKKEDILLQARQIKASLSQEHLETVIAELSPLPGQEKLVYKAKFIGISIGKFIIMNHGKKMLHGQEAYCYEVIVKTPPFFSIMFKPKERYVSYMDAQKFVVLRHEEYAKGGTILESAVDFDYKDLTATYKNYINHEEKVVKIPDKLLDVLCTIFYIRMLSLEMGDVADLNVYADQIIYNYIGLISSKTKVRLPHRGKQDAYRFTPRLFLDGQQIKKISTEVLFSTTLPSQGLRGTLKTIVGNVHVDLVEESEIL